MMAQRLGSLLAVSSNILDGSTAGELPRSPPSLDLYYIASDLSFPLRKKKNLGIFFGFYIVVRKCLYSSKEI
jgi:hypothetical protein